jgi:transposase InsO family protein
MKPNKRNAEGGRGRRKWPPEVRLQVAQAVVDRGATAGSLSKAFGIPVTTVVDWTQRYRRFGADAKAWWTAEMKQRKAALERRKGMDARREAVVKSRQDHPEHGTRRIRDVMARFEGLGVSETTVRRILHEEGLLEKVPEPVAKPGPAAHRFERAEPNQLWQSDIFTFLLRRYQRLYVTAFLDDFSRYVVSLAVAHHQRSSLVLEALTRGIAEYGAPREVLTDQGRQYVAWRGHTDFEGELRRQGIAHIKSRPHHPQTLGKIERFWKTLWDEFLSRTVFGDFEDCQRRIALFVQAYNFRRPHQGIGGVVPADRFFRAAPQVRAAIERGVSDNALALAQERPRRKPFYLVGRLGERDLSIALCGGGLLVKLGDTEETIALGREEDDEERKTPARLAQAPESADPEMALELGGDRPDGEGAVLAGAVGALGGEAGDGGHRGSGDLAGDVLQAGDAGSQRDAAGAWPSGHGGGTGDEPGAADRDSGDEGEGARARAAALAASAPHDAAGDEQRREENALDPWWQRSFAQIEAEATTEDGDGDEAPAFDATDDWRGRALTWERKLSGADEASHGEGEEELYGDAEAAAGGAGEVRDGDGGAGGRTERERGSAPAGPFPEPLPDGDAPRAGIDDRGAGPSQGRAAAGAGGAAAAAAGSGEAAPGERAPATPGGDDGPHPERGERPAQGTSRAKDAT